MQVAIAIATAGRREQLGRTLDMLADQARRPDRIVVCPASPEDFDGRQRAALGAKVEIVHGARGLCAQRNAILAVVQSADLVIFFDDDYYPAPDYIARVIELFHARPNVVLATNYPLRDGISGSGLTHDEAVSIVMESREVLLENAKVAPTYGGYGCNMAIRVSTLRSSGLLFDENLPLYGWLEDIDFSRRLAKHGEIVSCNALRGVHLGTKRGRTSGTRLGYSQIANPLYMMRKGSVEVRYGLKHIVRNVGSNLVKFARPEPWIDRRGRLCGNLVALHDLILGRLHPTRVMQL